MLRQASRTEARPFVTAIALVTFHEFTSPRCVAAQRRGWQARVEDGMRRGRVRRIGGARRFVRRRASQARERNQDRARGPHPEARQHVASACSAGVGLAQLQ